MNNTFSSHLQRLRKAARLTNSELARHAGVPESLISGLQNDSRRIGELQARKIGTALKLTAEPLEQFIYDAINHCSEKVLNDSKNYPAELLNLVARQLRHAGIFADAIHKCTVIGDQYEQDVTLVLGDGSKALLKTQLVCV